MTFYGDPDVSASRRQVREHAQEVRDRAGRARAAAHAARWRSAARERFIAELEDRIAALERARAGWMRLRTGSTSRPGRSGRRLRRSARRRRPCSGGSVRPRRRWSGRRRAASPPSWSGAWRWPRCGFQARWACGSPSCPHRETWTGWTSPARCVAAAYGCEHPRRNRARAGPPTGPAAAVRGRSPSAVDTRGDRRAPAGHATGPSNSWRRRRR